MFRSAVLGFEAFSGSIQHLLCIWPLKNQSEHPRDGNNLRDCLNRTPPAEFPLSLISSTRPRGHYNIFPSWSSVNNALCPLSRFSQLLQRIQSHHLHTGEKNKFDHTGT